MIAGVLELHRAPHGVVRLPLQRPARISQAHAGVQVGTGRGCVVRDQQPVGRVVHQIDAILDADDAERVRRTSCAAVPLVVEIETELEGPVHCAGCDARATV